MKMDFDPSKSLMATDTYSVRSDMSAWEDLSTLKAQASSKSREAQLVLHQCIQVETQLESGIGYLENASIRLLEQAIQEFRESLRKTSSEGRKLEELQHQKQIEFREHEISCLKQEIQASDSANKALREHIKELSQEHSKYREECTLSLSSLERQIQLLAESSPAEQNSSELNKAEEE